MEPSFESQQNLNSSPALEGIVLDAEGHILHDPEANQSKSHTHAKIAWSEPKRMGVLPKVLVGTAFAALLLVGLTIAGVVLGVLFVGLVGRFLFMPKRR